MKKNLFLERNPDPGLVKRFDFWVCMYLLGTVSEKKKYLAFINDIVLDPISSPQQIQHFITTLANLLGEKNSALTTENFDTLCCDVLKSSKPHHGYPDTETINDDYYKMLACISCVTDAKMRSHEVAEYQLSDIPDANYYRSEAMADIVQFEAKQKIQKLYSVM